MDKEITRVHQLMIMMLSGGTSIYDVIIMARREDYDNVIDREFRCGKVSL